MTKSEARAIHEATTRALLALDLKMPWGRLGSELAKEVADLHRTARDEIQRVQAMASAELGGAR